MSIPYAPTSWNPITGCSKISAGCDNCWAEETIQRHKDLPGYNHEKPFTPTFHPERLDQPRHWRKPKVVAVNFMGDWCHGTVLPAWRDEVWAVMRDCPQHTFVTSTKRPHLMVQEVGRLGWLKHVWLGVTVENMDEAKERIPALVRVENAYLNYEPALGPIDWRELFRFGDVYFKNIAGVIVGAESGPRARAFDPAWATATLKTCRYNGPKFYMKQMDAKNGGADWDKWPESLKHLKVRDLPWKL